MKGTKKKDVQNADFVELEVVCTFNLQGILPRVLSELHNVLRGKWDYAPEFFKVWLKPDEPLVCQGKYVLPFGRGSYDFSVDGESLSVEFVGSRNLLLRGTPNFRLRIPEAYDWNTLGHVVLELPSISIRGWIQVRWKA